MTKLDFDSVRLAEGPVAKQDRVREQLARFSPEDPPNLTDIYMKLNDGGQEFLMALERQEKESLDGGKPFLWTMLA